MISIVQGMLYSINEDTITLLVGGIGLDVAVPSRTYTTLASEVGQTVILFTHLVVREDSLRLFGFSTREEEAIFRLLMTVQGVGPRLALAVLSTLSPELLANAIQRDDPDVIAHVPGVGKKTAQKIVIELKGKLRAEAMPHGLDSVSSVDTEVIAALTALGYSIVEAQAALQSIPRDAPDDVEEHVRLALGYFADR